RATLSKLKLFPLREHGSISSCTLYQSKRCGYSGKGTLTPNDLCGPGTPLSDEHSGAHRLILKPAIEAPASSETIGWCSTSRAIMTGWLCWLNTKKGGCSFVLLAHMPSTIELMRR